MQLGLHQTARMEQRLFQSPQMIQAMQILQLSSLDLRARIEEELLENPLLERKESPEANDSAEGRTSEESDQLAALDAMLALREGDRRDSSLRCRGSIEESDKKHEALQNTPVLYRSLGESLQDQIVLIELSDRQRDMVQVLLFSLDPRGYLPCSLSLLVEECGIEGATEDDFSLLLEEIRHATHPALGSRGLRECLLLQVDEMAEESPLLRILIEEKLEDIAANRLPHIARSTGRSIEEVAQAVEVLRSLDPCPGSAYGEAPAEVIRPEIVVEAIEGTFQVRLTREAAPELRLNAYYSKLLRETPRGDLLRKWIRERVVSARAFIHALGQRQNTLLCVAQAIFERQGPFLEKGHRALQPLRMGDVAAATGLHISTVSRAVSGMYAQTPQGILPLRSFFSGGTANSSGGMASQKSVQERLKQLVREEDPSDPLSDVRLAELLRDRDGICLARRTITKYRKILAIFPSGQRRVY
jgi:RNA polymerase sigma-54 factor